MSDWVVRVAWADLFFREEWERPAVQGVSEALFALVLPDSPVVRVAWADLFFREEWERPAAQVGAEPKAIQVMLPPLIAAVDI